MFNQGCYFNSPCSQLLWLIQQYARVQILPYQMPSLSGFFPLASTLQKYLSLVPSILIKACLSSYYPFVKLLKGFPFLLVLPT